jgi:hypothetical protein
MTSKGMSTLVSEISKMFSMNIEFVPEHHGSQPNEEKKTSYKISGV